MKLKVKVTKEILFKSANCVHRHDPAVRTSCAFALAVRELFPMAQVYQFTSNLLGGCGLLDQIHNPEVMRNFIKRFDELDPVERVFMPETEVEIDVPLYVVNSIGLSEVYKILSESKTLELAESFDTI